MSRIVKGVSRELVECFRVQSRDGTEWARIFLDRGVQENGDGWGQLSVISTFGNFGHSFCNIGKRSFAEFLRGLSFDYLMGKLLGTQLRLFDAEANLARLRKEVYRARRNKEIEREEARDFRECLRNIKESGCANVEAFMYMLAEGSGRLFHEWELHTGVDTRLNPQAVGFWEQIWPVFCDQLHQESAETPARALTAAAVQGPPLIN